SVRDITDILLRGPELNVHDESAAAGNHHRRGEATGHVMRAHAGLEHRVPTPERLLPELARPRELAVLHHVFVAAPDIVDENVEPAVLARDAVKNGTNLRIFAMVAAKRNNFACARFHFANGAACGVNRRAALCEHASHALSNAAACACD